MDNMASLSVIVSHNIQDSSGNPLVPVAKKTLVNRINYLNFKDESLTVVFRHIRYEHTLCLTAFPAISADGLLRCVWKDAGIMSGKMHKYSITHIIVPDQQRPFRVEPHVREITPEHVIFEIPEQCHQLGTRQIQRHVCQSIEVQAAQNGAMFSGSLIDFSPVSFRVLLERPVPHLFGWLNADVPLQVSLISSGNVLYSGTCLILKEGESQERREYVVAPENHHIQRFGARQHRCSRYRLQPAPSVTFCHPLTGRIVTLKTQDLSASGLSVTEDSTASVLLVGMVIPRMEIVYSTSFKVSCSAQVVYRRDGEGGGSRQVVSGLAFLDMEMGAHTEYLSLLQQVKDGNSSVNGAVDMEALWAFFFETGFIYPEKYAFVKTSKEELKETYRRLYMEHPTIARHFTYQEHGRILGHFATFRFYENTWINHHHAAVKSAHNRAGLVVLSQLSRYINDSKNLASAHMRFIAGYFRPENRFPKRFFGGCASFINDRKKCSIDPFAYFHYFRQETADMDMETCWSLPKTVAEDLQELAICYEHISGGLAITALDLQPDMLKPLDIEQEYRRLGFKRERHLFSLKKNGHLKVVAMVTVSDVGLNMSEVTNAIHLFVVDDEGVSRAVINRMLWLLSAKYEREPVPVLVFPQSFAVEHKLPVEKVYSVWVLNVQYTDDYMNYMEQVLHSERFNL